MSLKVNKEAQRLKIADEPMSREVQKYNTMKQGKPNLQSRAEQAMIRWAASMTNIGSEPSGNE